MIDNPNFMCLPGTTSFVSSLVRLASVGTNPGLFSDQIPVHFGSPSKNVLKPDLKKSRNCPILGQFEPLLEPNIASLVSAGVNHSVLSSIDTS